jgi:hypothetical protein
MNIRVELLSKIEVLSDRGFIHCEIPNGLETLCTVEEIKSLATEIVELRAQRDIYKRAVRHYAQTGHQRWCDDESGSGHVTVSVIYCGDDPDTPGYTVAQKALEDAAKIRE